MGYRIAHYFPVLQVCNHSDGTKSLKLGDFGLAVEARTPLFTVCGTPTYVAPEILADTGYVCFWVSYGEQVWGQQVSVHGHGTCHQISELTLNVFA